LKWHSLIRRAREVGITIKEVRGLLAPVDGGDFTCAEVRNRTLIYSEGVATKIHFFRKMKRVLKFFLRT
jgi:MerR family mercuric resistance operon transcriptional regulator